MKKIFAFFIILSLLAVVLPSCKGGGGGSSAKFEELEKILDKQKELKDVLIGINTLDDLKAKKDTYVALNIAILKMSVASLKKVLTMSRTDQLAYAAKNAKMQQDNQALAVELLSFNKKLAGIKGGMEYLTELSKLVGKETIPLATELQKLYKQLQENIK